MDSEQLLELLETILATIFDAIEETVGLFSRPSTKYLTEMFIVICIMGGLSMLLQYLDMPVFISQYECLVAGLVLGVFLLVSYVNRIGIDNLKKKLGRRN